MRCVNPYCRDHAKVVLCPSCWMMVVLAKIAEVLIVWAFTRVMLG